MKQGKHFCTLCPLQSDDVHQPNEEWCQQFCQEKEDDWCCYHHSILCSDVKEGLLAEVEQLKVSIAADLEGIGKNSKIRYYPNPEAPACRSSNSSIHFAPQNDDDRDVFIDLLTDELLFLGLSPTGELEDLWQWLMEEVVVEDKLCRHLEELLHCDALTACMIAILHKIPCILHCENRV